MRPMISLPARAVAVMLAAAVAMPAAIVAAPPAYARPAPDSFADLAARLLPGVVNISSSQTITADKGDKRDFGPEIPQFPPGSPFEQFFRDFMERNHHGQNHDPASPPRKTQSLGSGFIIDSSGIVVTNNHVIDDADEITVILQDNTTLKAKLIGRDQRTDIAVLKVNPEKPLTALSFGDSDASRVGDWVLAIGNPFGLGGTVTAGIVSARGRDINQGPYDNFIQTDAAINRGNSGGPLFNMDGEVIGINTAIYSPSGGSIGIGFSIPANLAKTVVAQLRDFGHARRGWLGVKIQQVTPDIAESLGLKDATGAMVAGITDGGPADKAKLKSGDIILKFDGQDVKERHNLPRIVADSAVGKEVPVVVWRDGKEVTVQTTLAERPADQQLASIDANKPVDTTKPTDITGLGLKVAPVSQELKDKFQLQDGQKGVVITDVAPNSAAAEKGLKPGDVIMEVQQGEITSPADVEKQVDAARGADRKFVLMLIQREGGVQYVPLSLGKAAAGKDKQPG